MIKVLHMVSTNFGDRIAPDIVRYLSGDDASYSCATGRFLVTGSILVMAVTGDTVWGAGAMFDTQLWTIPPDIKVCAVRGPLTRKLLLTHGIACPGIYGDPGILVPSVYGVTATPTCALGIIPHYIDTRYIPALQSVYPEAKIIDITTPPLEFVKSVASCASILSSSLHGLITAESLGIPAAWIRLSDNVAGGDFKFDDYYLGSGRPVQAACDWRTAFSTPKFVELPVCDYTEFINSCPFITAEVQASLINSVVPQGLKALPVGHR